MNYLAHLYLSGDNEEIKLGNFFADEIKGHKYFHLPCNIQKGILLHREIDYFTDNHKEVKKITAVLHSNHGKTSGIIVDMFFDYFLSNNWERYSAVSLEGFCANFYKILEDNNHLLPPLMKSIYRKIIKEDWLLKYRNLEELFIILTRMDNKIGLHTNMQNSIYILKENEREFERGFFIFFDDIISFTKNMVLL